MTKEEAYIELRKLMPYEYQESFRKGLEEALNGYKTIINNLDVMERCEDWDDKLNIVNNNIELLFSTIDNYYAGRHELARQQIEEILTSTSSVTTKYGVDENDFYRMRKVGNTKGMKYTEMFHIPLNMRGIVSTQRYSMPGYPCLYLGISIYTCWEEMNRPYLNSCVFSRFKNTKEFETLDLTIPKKSEWCDELQIIITRLPLIIACMIKVKNKKDVFKPEYIIPQLVTECVINKSIKGICGVSYTSVEICNEFDFPEDKFLNIALPVMNESGIDRKYCPVLSSIFQLTKPTSYEIEKIRSDFEGPSWQIIGNSKTLENIAIENYKDSAFGRLEERLKDENIFPLNTMPDE